MTGRDGSRQDRRRRAILETAREAFLGAGYGATSMSSIAAELGGSKTTLWSYFRNKDELFAAVIDDLVERFGDALRLPLPDDGDPVEVLTMFGRTVMRTILRPEIVKLHRLVIGETGRIPQLGRMLWQRGAARGQERLAKWLGGQMELGVLKQGDPQNASAQFFALCQAGSYFRHLIGGGRRPAARTIDAEVAAAVDTFLGAFRR